MRRRKQPAAGMPPPPGPPPPAPYDWTRFGRHRFRTTDGAIVDLPVPVAGAAAVWVATMWPDHHAPGGWVRHPWPLHPTTGRGWLLPRQLAAGDVIEFGADTPHQPVRWYGIMDTYQVDHRATVQGPYPHPAAAHDDAQRLLALERFLPALDSEPSPAPKPCHRAAAQRRRHQHRRP